MSCGEVSANGLRQGLRSINDEQPRHRRIKPALDKILDQGLSGRGTLRRAFGKAERMLVTLRIDADRCHEGHILVHMNAVDLDHQQIKPGSVLRQAWELDDADKAEKLLRNLARRLERDWAGIAGSILEGID